MTENQLTYGNKAKNLEFVARNTDIEIPYFKQIYLEGCIIWTKTSIKTSVITA